MKYARTSAPYISLAIVVVVTVLMASSADLLAATNDAAISTAITSQDVMRGVEKSVNLAVNSTAARWGDSVEGFQLAAYLQKTEFDPSEAVLVTIIMKNVSDMDLSWAESRPECDFIIVARSASGELVPRTQYGEQLIRFGRTMFRRVSLRVSPGEELKYTIDVGRLYDLSMTGEYYIIIETSVRKREGDASAKLTSNTVSFRIRESGAEF